MMKQKVDDGYFANGLVQPSKNPTETRRNPQKPHKVFSWLSTIFSFAKNPVQGKCKNAVVNNTKICAFFSSPIFAAPKPQDQQQPTINFKSMKTPAFLFKQRQKIQKIRQNHPFSQELALMVLSFLSPCSHLELSIGALGLDTSVGRFFLGQPKPWF